MKKAVFAALIAAMAGISSAQVQEHSSTSSNTRSSIFNSGSSYSTTASIGTLFFPLLANNISSKDQKFNELMGICKQIFNGAPYAYSMRKETHTNIIKNGGRITSLQENDIAIPIKFNEEVVTIDYVYEKIGKPIQHSIAMLCMVTYNGVISRALENIPKNGNSFINPNDSQVASAFRKGINSYIDNQWSSDADAYQKMSDTTCTIPTFTGITVSKRTNVICGNLEYQPAPLKFIANGVVMLSADTINGNVISFTSQSGKTSSSGTTSTRSRTQKANVAN